VENCGKLRTGQSAGFRGAVDVKAPKKGVNNRGSLEGAGNTTSNTARIDGRRTMRTVHDLSTPYFDALAGR
jgi:hypothetical protein